LHLVVTMLGEALTPTTHTSPSRARLLLVEDDADIRETLSDALGWEGYEVELAIHGRAALDRLAHGPRVDLILLDLMMPVMNGWEFRRHQLADPELAGIPVVVLSASSPEACHPDRYLPKPFSVEELLTVIDELVTQGPLAA
jgi:CheY-like chemotaxis protein